jgi:peptide/nickel transport system permease protein
MNFQFDFLFSDYLLFFLVMLSSLLLWRACKKRQWRETWKKVITQPLGMVALVILMVYVTIALLDSIHFRQALPSSTTEEIQYSVKTTSLLDVLLGGLASHHEKSYSAPLAQHSYTKYLTYLEDGSHQHRYEPLLYAATHMRAQHITQARDVTQRFILALFFACIIFSLTLFFFIMVLAHYHQQPRKKIGYCICVGHTTVAWRSAFMTMGVILLLACLLTAFAMDYHVFGTDKVGNDVFYMTLKSIRTGLVIGSVTTLIMLPFALLLGTMAGYFGGWIDDIIQYLYTTLSSIPGVLLVAAAVLSLQIYIDNHADFFTTLDSQADMRLMALCVILGMSSWTSLCRVLRAETLKVRELEYIQAAHALGTRWLKIITQHILPNVIHIVVITLVLDFSGFILAEAVLSYVGIGVAPTTYSWGNMINSARLELAREPIVWWPLLSAFTFMFIFVLAANLLADAVNSAFNPRRE